MVPLSPDPQHRGGDSCEDILIRLPSDLSDLPFPGLGTTVEHDIRRHLGAHAIQYQGERPTQADAHGSDALGVHLLVPQQIVQAIAQVGFGFIVGDEDGDVPPDERLLVSLPAREHVRSQRNVAVRGELGGQVQGVLRQPIPLVALHYRRKGRRSRLRHRQKPVDPITEGDHGGDSPRIGVLLHFLSPSALSPLLPATKATFLARF